MMPSVSSSCATDLAYDELIQDRGIGSTEVGRPLLSLSWSSFFYLAAPATNLDAPRARIRSCRVAHRREDWTLGETEWRA